MAILAIDTALDHCQAAVITPAGEVVSVAGGLSQGNAEAIVQHAAQALDDSGWQAITCVAVTVGPGSFTGVRVGLAYAQGIAAPRGWPVVGVGTLTVLAAEADGPTLAATDARHGNLYAGLFGLANAAPPARMSAEAARQLAASAGAGIITYGAEPLLPGATPITRVSLSHLARLAAALDPAAHPPQAVYLADPDAAPQRHKALARR